MQLVPLQMQLLPLQMQLLPLQMQLLCRYSAGLVSPDALMRHDSNAASCAMQPCSRACEVGLCTAVQSS
jgi:hypothetical protein